MSARDHGEVSWETLTERLRGERDAARLAADYWKGRYEALARSEAPGPESPDFLGCRE